MRRALFLIVLCGLVWAGQLGRSRAGVPLCPGMSSPVQQTGLHSCFDRHGSWVSCAGTGQDAEYRAGITVYPRFTENRDGTVTDNLTGLIWLQDADCFGATNWTDALSDANSLADGSCGLWIGGTATGRVWCKRGKPHRRRGVI